MLIMLKFLEKYQLWIVAGLLALMFGLGVTSMAGDSGIVDEVAHIPAGYSYLKYGDYRLNPEHPPLIKDLAAVPLLFMRLKFPITEPAWTTDANGQWESGWNFIYHIGNNADQILFYARLPILLLAIAFGAIIYWFTRRRFGVPAALLALFFYALSPNILAHARLVTTDLGIATFTFVSFYTFLNWMEKPDRRHMILAITGLTLAEIAKFSAALIIPFFIIIVIIAVITWQKPGTWQQRAKLYLGGLFLIFIASFALIWLFYAPHTRNLPLAKQDQLIEASLAPDSPVRKVLLKINHLPLMEPLAQYGLGIGMVFNRVSSGNTTYFLGQVTNQSFAWYFPVTYLIKTPLAFQLLTLIVLINACYLYFRKTPTKPWAKFKTYSQNHFTELTFLGFIIFYAYFSIRSNLNLGIRHLFPIIPLITVLVAVATIRWIEALGSGGLRRAAQIFLGLMVIWYALANFWIYPSYLAYFNELIGGPANANKYVSDSSVDWGQDLKRLVSYVHDHPEINHIAVDYFGGGDPKYYFCNRKYNPDDSLVATAAGYDCSHSPYVEWHAQNGPYPGQYIAVSETFLENDIYYQTQRPNANYKYLRDKTPITKIGYSIYVYKLY